MRILITGAAGFIGSSVVRRLLAAGHSVVGVDAFVPNYSRVLKERNIADCRAHAHFEFHELDLRTAPIAPLLEGVEAVIHEAAMPGLAASWTHFEEYVTCNLMATHALLEACRNRPPPGRLHLN